jgi:PAS domain S-box-containing protein
MREAEDRYYTLFNLTQEVVYLTTRGGRICDVNEAAIELLGYTREELVELQAGKLYSEVPDTRRIKQDLKAHGLVRDISVRLRAKDGSSISGLLSVSPRRSGGEAVGGYQCLIRPTNHGPSDQPTVVLESIDVAPAPDTSRTAAPETGAREAEPRQVPGMPGEAGTRKQGRLEVGKRTQQKYQPSPAFDSAPKWHRKPWTLVVVLGAVVALFGWTDLVALTYPYNAGLGEWQLAVRLLALTLLALGVAGQAWWRTARGVAIGLALLGLTLLVVYINYVRGFPFELRDAVPDTQPQIDTAILGASGFAVALLLFCGWVSWRLWTDVRPEQTHPRVIM